MKRQICLVIFAIFAILCTVAAILPATAQKNSSSFPNGFHIGITGEGNIAQKMAVIQTSGSWPESISHPAWGWETGLELSYHFAKYFGVSVAAVYGTVAQIKYDVYVPLFEYFGEEDRYDPAGNTQLCRFQIPVKFEFHTPLTKNFSFCGSIGMNIKNITSAIRYAYLKERLPLDVAVSLCNYRILHSSNVINNPYYFESFLEEELGHKIQLDLLLSIGVYYQLPYNDLIRASLIGNFSFNDKLKGIYEYPLANTSGTMSYRHNHIGLELAYIHCFRTKAQRAARRESKGK